MCAAFITTLWCGESHETDALANHCTLSALVSHFFCYLLFENTAVSSLFLFLSVVDTFFGNPF